MVAIFKNISFLKNLKNLHISNDLQSHMHMTTKYNFAEFKNTEKMYLSQKRLEETDRGKLGNHNFGIICIVIFFLQIFKKF